MLINKEDLPKARWRNVMYGRVVVSYRPEKKDPNRTILTVGGDKLHCPIYCCMITVALLTEKLILNSVISTPGSRYMTLDIKDFLSINP